MSLPTGSIGSSTGPIGPAGPASPTAPNGTTSPQPTTAAGVTQALGSNAFKLTDGWYLTIAIGTGIALANTKLAPVAFGILTLGLIYQTSLLLQGK